MSIRKNSIQRIVILIILFGWFVLGLFFCVQNYSDIISLINNLAAIVGIPASISAIYSIVKKTNSLKGDQNGDADKVIWLKNWWNHNSKWVAIASALIFLSALCYNYYEKQQRIKTIALMEQHRQDSIQRCFADLDSIFENRMKQKLTYENAKQVLYCDNNVLQQMLLMLDENPEIIAVSKGQYTECLRNRADTAITIIIDAVYDTALSSSEIDSMSKIYNPIIKEIEQMRDAL